MSDQPDPNKSSQLIQGVDYSYFTSFSLTSFSWSPPTLQVAPVWSNNLALSPNVQISGDASIEGDLHVQENLFVGGDLKIGGEAAFLVLKEDLNNMTIEELLTHQNTSLRELTKIFIKKLSQDKSESF